jgi:hypothetical protein
MAFNTEVPAAFTLRPKTIIDHGVIAIIGVVFVLIVVYLHETVLKR